MPVDLHSDSDLHVATIAGAIAEPARAKMLCALMDGRARTSTELAVLAEVSPSTASVHLTKLRDQHCVVVMAQGKHRYYQLASPEVARVLEALMTMAGLPRPIFQPSTPERLRKARTCYDHLAGEIAVKIHDYLIAHAWVCVTDIKGDASQYVLTEKGKAGLSLMGIAYDDWYNTRRKIACACLDWSERRPHCGGALGALLLQHGMSQAWYEADLEGRALTVTAKGRRQLKKHFSMDV